MISRVNQNRGFTLVEVLVVIAIIAILAAIIVLVINPLELINRSKDSTRMQDLNNLVSAINLALQDSNNSPVHVLCKDKGSYECGGRSNQDLRLTNGSGWVKADLATLTTAKFTSLPIDPVNNEELHYTYCADNDQFEINATLESYKEKSRMYSDGGNDSDRYEVGSNLNLIANTDGSCEY